MSAESSSGPTVPILIWQRCSPADTGRIPDPNHSWFPLRAARTLPWVARAEGRARILSEPAFGMLDSAAAAQRHQVVEAAQPRAFVGEQRPQGPRPALARMLL